MTLQRVLFSNARKKACESALNGATVVCLVPARTDTRWWHRYGEKGEIRYLLGRLKFVGAKHADPSPSAVVIFRGAKLPCRRVCCTVCPLQGDLD